MTEYNYYLDTSHPLKPYLRHCVANKGSLPPPNATRTAPPPEVAGKWRVYKGGHWDYADDHRGETGYVYGKPTAIKDIGPYPAGWSETPPQPTAQELKNRAISEALAKLNEIDSKSIRPIRAIKRLEEQIAATAGISGDSGLAAELGQEKVCLAGLEDQARAERAKLAELGLGAR